MSPRSGSTFSVSSSRRPSYSDHGYEHGYDNGTNLCDLPCFPPAEQRDMKKPSPRCDENLPVSQSVENAVGPQPESILRLHLFFPRPKLTSWNSLLCANLLSLSFNGRSASHHSHGAVRSLTSLRKQDSLIHQLGRVKTDPRALVSDRIYGCCTQN